MYGMSYEEYLHSAHWAGLRDKHIYKNKRSHCWICGLSKTKYLLRLHHESYRRLGEEKLGRDIFIICKSCHKALHFTFKVFKSSLDERVLRKRRYLLRLRHELLKGRVLPFVWYLSRSVTV